MFSVAGAESGRILGEILLPCAAGHNLQECPNVNVIIKASAAAQVLGRLNFNGAKSNAFDTLDLEQILGALLQPVVLDRAPCLDLDTVSFATASAVLALELNYNTDFLDLANHSAPEAFRQYFGEVRALLPALANRVAARDALTGLFLGLLGACAVVFPTNEVYGQSARVFAEKSPDELQTQRVLNGLGNDTPPMQFYVLEDRARLKFRVSDFQDSSQALRLGQARGVAWTEGYV